jgi:HSP20 family protein
MKSSTDTRRRKKIMAQATHDTQVSEARNTGEVVEKKDAQVMEEEFYIPPVDIYETGEKLMLLIDVPGIVRENINLTVEQHLLTIEAKQTPPPAPEKNVKWLWREHEAVSYRRQFRLGEEIDVEGIGSALRNGVLRVTLPKVKPAQPRRIEVRIAE